MHNLNKIILNKDEVYDLILDNRYRVDVKNKFLSRCIDGRYENSDELPALAFPGADAGELALIAATANAFGFEVDLDKAYQSLLNIIGGVKNFNMHTDDHHDPKVTGAGCGHLGQIKTDPKAYQLTEVQIKQIDQILETAKKNGAKETILKGPHLEGAVLLVKGDYGIKPQCYLEEEKIKRLTQVFIYQQTLVNSRHKVWAKELMQSKVVKLYDNTDEEYLYEVLSEQSELHLFETVERLGKDLPLFHVQFDERGGFSLQEMGRV